MKETLTSDEREALEYEFCYTSYDASCRNPALVAAPDNALETRECRRQQGHPGFHASGFGSRLVRW
jgi:hypothetical protein